MSAVAVAITVLAVTSKVGKEGGTSLELGVGGLNTSIYDVDAGALTSTGVVGVRSAASLAVGMGDTRQTPGGRALGSEGPLLNAVNLAEVGLDNGILLDIFNLVDVSIVSSSYKKKHSRQGGCGLSRPCHQPYQQRSHRSQQTCRHEQGPSSKASRCCRRAAEGSRSSS